MRVMRSVLLAARRAAGCGSRRRAWGSSRRRSAASCRASGSRMRSAAAELRRRASRRSSPSSAKTSARCARPTRWRRTMSTCCADRGDGLDCLISVKLTQLGLDVDESAARTCATSPRAQAHDFLWIDMEQHGYVDVTLDSTGACWPSSPTSASACRRISIAPKDLTALIPLGGGVRLVKGAYLEPADIAFPKKADVDANYLELAKQMIGPEARKSGFRAVFGTHDSRSFGRFRSTRPRPACRRRLRIRSAVRHPAQRAAAARARRHPHPRAHRLRRLLVPLVHAPAGRTSRRTSGSSPSRSSQLILFNRG